MELILASTNLNKVREIKEMLGPIPGIDLLSLASFPDYVQPEEDGETCEENAIIKGRHAALELQRWVLADDSGVVVPALGGAPGVHSARYAGRDATYKENRQKLLAEMRGLEGVQRAAYFECWIVLAGPNGEMKAVCGKCEGEILEEERGSSGFCYDSIFRKYDYSKSFGELSADVKNRISHRFRAIDQIKPHIQAII